MTTDLTKTTDTPSPLTPEDQRRIAVLRAVTEAIRSRQVFGAGPADAIDVVHISNWVLGTFDPWAPTPEAPTPVDLDDDTTSHEDESAEQRPWAAGDVVRLNEPSTAAKPAAIGQDGWYVTGRGAGADGEERLLDECGRLFLRHPSLIYGLSRLPGEVTLVTPAGGAA